MGFENIITKLESLPPLSDTAFEIQRVYAGGFKSLDIIKLVRIIENDAVLAANILRMVNAPIYGFSRKIASISQAVTLLGTDEIYGLVIKYAIEEKLQADMSIYGISNTEFNDICHLQSTLIMQWYSRIDTRHAQFISPLALIMESGKLILANEIKKNAHAKTFLKEYKKTNDIIEFEYDLFNTTTYYLSAMLFEHWRLEPLYVEILKGLDFEIETGSKVRSYIESLDVVRTAVNLRNILTKESIGYACDIVEEIGLDADSFKQVALRVKNRYDLVLKDRIKNKSVDGI